jgi:hypothetical protein
MMNVATTSTTAPSTSAVPTPTAILFIGLSGIVDHQNRVYR